MVRSFDRGQTWEDVSNGFEYPDIHMIVRRREAQHNILPQLRAAFLSPIRRKKAGSEQKKGMESDYFHDVINLPGERPAMFFAGGHGSPQYWDQPGGVQGRIYRSEDDGESVAPSRRGPAGETSGDVLAVGL